MIPTLNRVAVLGAGTMGAQIAAHLANLEIRTLLLDLPSAGPDRSAVARKALERLSSVEPAPLYASNRARFIEIGNFDDHLAKLSDCDWIIEGVVEKLDVKQKLWERVEAHRRPGTIVSTNTSGLPVARIAEGRSPDFRRHWLGTHFFNPPRYMRLLEVIPGPDTLPEVVQTIAFVGDRLLGKGVVVAKDTPNFVANRIGAFVGMRASELMQELGLTFEEIDALTGPVIGRPNTGTFRLADLVGVDVMVDVSENLYQNLAGDPWREQFRPAQFMREMVSRGWTGRKAGQGFYKKIKGGSGDEFQTLDPETMEYRPQKRPAVPSLEMARNEPDLVQRVKALLAAPDKAGAFLWPFLCDTFAYSAERIPEIADEYFHVDRAMKWGYNWEMGPFEMWQALGIEDVVRRAEKEGKTFPSWIGDLLKQRPRAFYVVGPHHQLFFDLGSGEYQVLPGDPEKIELAVLRQRERVIRSNAGASLIDLGDGVACLEFHSKMNAIGADIVGMARASLEEVSRNFLALVIANQGKDFSVGANLMLLLLEAQEGNWEDIDLAVRAFQDLNMSFRYSSKPVVAAPFQRVLGGGTEICLGCDAVVASAETYMGLVETGVGLIPAGGGTKEMLLRHPGDWAAASSRDLFPAVRRVFETIGMAKVSRSADEARQLRFLRESDFVEIHPERLLFRAKEKALSLVKDGYAPPQPRSDIPVLGAAGLASLKVGIHLMRRAGYISEYDAVVGRKLAHVLTGGDLNHPTTVSEQYLLDLEREAFLFLCGQRKTQERIQYTLKTGKPLRN